jgi:hypothetical protein
MMDTLHKPALDKIANAPADSYVNAFYSLAQLADESEAENAELTLSWHDNSEKVSAKYVPEVILRVVKVQ